MKCYDRITGKVYESSYNIIEEAEKWFTTENGKMMGTLDQYLVWMIDMVDSNWLDIDDLHTIIHKLNLEGTVGEIEFESEIDDTDGTIMLVLNFVV